MAPSSHPYNNRTNIEREQAFEVYYLSQFGDQPLLRNNQTLKRAMRKAWNAAVEECIGEVLGHDPGEMINGALYRCTIPECIEADLDQLHSKEKK